MTVNISGQEPTQNQNPVNTEVQHQMHRPSRIQVEQPQQAAQVQQAPQQEAASIPAPSSISEFADRVTSNMSPEQILGTAPGETRQEQSVEYTPSTNPNVHLSVPYSSVSSNTPINLAVDGVTLLAERNTQERNVRVNNLFNFTNKKEAYNYAIAYEAANKVAGLTGNMFNAAIDRKGSSWHQHLKTETGKIAYMSPKFAEEGVGKATGKKALLRVRSLMGKGGLVQIPLFRSGFWITIKAPSESAQIELNRRIGEEKISLGRQTHGLIFSNNESFLNGWLVDFAIEHMYDTTLKNAEDIRSKIKAADVPILIWGIALSIYPRGFNYTRSLTDPEGIRRQELATALINVSKLLWVDNAFFTPQQTAQMALRQAGSITDEMMEQYQKSMHLGTGRAITMIEGKDGGLGNMYGEVKIVLREPTVAESVDATHRWISDLTALINNTFTQHDPDDESRNKMVATHARASQARAFSAWVEKIVVENDEITSPEDIEEYLELLSEDSDATEKFIEHVKTFINDLTCAVIAIPEASGQVDDTLQQFPQLIPINVSSVFFILLVQSVGRIISKKSLV